MPSLNGKDDGLVHFTWETATETGNAGFNLYMEIDGNLVPVNANLIPSTVIDSVVPVRYTYQANVAGEQYYIDMVYLSGEVERRGPFALGEEYGTPSQSPETPGMMAHPLFLPVISGR